MSNESSSRVGDRPPYEEAIELIEMEGAPRHQPYVNDCRDSQVRAESILRAAHRFRKAARPGRPVRQAKGPARAD